MEQQIKQLRVELDGLTQLVKHLTPSREVSLTYTSLQLSKMWLGKVLKELGTPNPYPESKTPTKYVAIQDIESTHGLILAGTESNKVKDGYVIFTIGEGASYEVDVSFSIDTPYIGEIANEKIEPTADTATSNNEQGVDIDPKWILEGGEIDHFRWVDSTHIQKVKWLRGEIERIENRLHLLYEETCRLENRTTIWLHQHVVESTSECIKAGMWLGMELGRVRDMEAKS